MTTNHRPTLESKKGRNNAIQDSIKHARALPQNTRLKFRSDVRKPILSHSKGNKAVKELKEELLLSEIATDGEKRSKDIADKEISIPNAALLPGVTGSKENHEHASDDESTTGNEPQHESEHNTSSSEEEEEEEETDDEDELIMQELAKIKKERALKKENDSAAKEKDDVSLKNPLLNIDKNRATGTPKASSWRKTTTFRNEKSQRNEEDYTNDTLKSGFHQKFLSKYIQ
ncbi:Piso0_005723 [Millerozyma farinosa CBS 7064]|uniref:Pre-mRNA-splicing factor CWC15 n=1 Tax=Pichia sorbitophila (strain ATCC MYA-4447 / BCRC 22081 / CBS 7064 / NBRC 10061 / NRRL Y-12695) TaxID=559304 RepID=G8XZS1_PICSO|nr:Piso0_005723 [Millerozyma farinosa CBS 7064]